MALPTQSEISITNPSDEHKFEERVPEEVRKVHGACRELKGMYRDTASDMVRGLEAIRDGRANGTIKPQEVPGLLEKLRPGAELMDTIKGNVETLGQGLQQKGYPVGPCKFGK